jgi:hypothetical protein
LSYKFYDPTHLHFVSQPLINHPPSFPFSPFCFVYSCARAKFLWLKLKLSRERKWQSRVKGYTAVPSVSTFLHGHRQNHRPNKNKGKRMTKFYQLQPKESRVDGGLCPSSWVSLSRSQTHACTVKSEPEGQPRNYANLTSTACQEIVPQQYIMQQPHTANPAQLETCSPAVHHTAVYTKCSSPTWFPTSTHNSTPCSSTSTHSSTPCSSFSSSLMAAHSAS